MTLPGTSYGAQQDVSITPKFCQAPRLASLLTSRPPSISYSAPRTRPPETSVPHHSSLFPAASSKVQAEVSPSSWIDPESNVPSYQIFTFYLHSMGTTFHPEPNEQLAVSWLGEGKLWEQKSPFWSLLSTPSFANEDRKVTHDKKEQSVNQIMCLGYICWHIM